MLICTITHILTININIAHHIAPRGPAWHCHVALRATSHPRGSRAKIKPIFAFIFIVLIIKNRKINSKNPKKSLKNRKFINFKI